MSHRGSCHPKDCPLLPCTHALTPLFLSFLALVFLSFPSYLSLLFLSLPFLTFPFLTFPYLYFPFLSFPYLSVPFLSLPFLSFPFPSLFLSFPPLLFLSFPFITFLSFPFPFLPRAEEVGLARKVLRVNREGKWVSLCGRSMCAERVGWEITKEIMGRISSVTRYCVAFGHPGGIRSWGRREGVTTYASETED